MAQNLVDVLVQHPLFWLAIIIFAIGFLYDRYKKNQVVPESKPYFGIEVFEELNMNNIQKYVKMFGRGGTFDKRKLRMGWIRIGKVVKYAIVSKKELPKEIKQLVYEGKKKRGKKKDNKSLKKDRKGDELVIMKVGSFDLPNALLNLFGRGYEYIITNMDAVRFISNAIELDKNHSYRHYGGVWVRSNDVEREFVDELMFTKDYEDLRGRIGNFTRQLSNVSPSQAIHTERLRMENELQEKSKLSKIKRITKGD